MTFFLGFICKSETKRLYLPHLLQRFRHLRNRLEVGRILHQPLLVFSPPFPFSFPFFPFLSFPFHSIPFHSIPFLSSPLLSSPSPSPILFLSPFFPCFSAISIPFSSPSLYFPPSAPHILSLLPFSPILPRFPLHLSPLFLKKLKRFNVFFFL